MYTHRRNQTEKRQLVLLSLSAVLICSFLVVTSCSTEKKAFLNKAYHYTTARFNGYFHGKEALKEAKKNLFKNHVDDFDEVLSVYRTGSEQQVQAQYALLDRAIMKANLMIDRHSMKFKVKRQKEEYNPMIDDCYFLLAEAYFYKMQYDSAERVCKYMISAYPESKLLYQVQLRQIRALIYQEDYVAVETKFKALEDENKTPKNLKGEFHTLRALYYIRNKENTKAIEQLEKAISYAKKKRFRMRLSYIEAQLLAQEGKKREAELIYERIAKKSLVYDMAFSAQLNAAKLHEGSDANIVSTLNKMLKDDKNNDYKDQIYYTLGELSQKKGRKEEARDYFKQSVQSSTSNIKQKSLAYLALAEEYFSDPEYVKAQRYYDSSLVALPETYPNYDLISSKAENLNDLVAHLDAISREDSLQRIAKMSKEEQLAFVEQLIEKEEEEQAAQEREQLAKIEAIKAAAAAQQQTGGGWIFDNPTLLATANAEFVAIWGNRKLEDNWRRSDKTTVNFDEGVEEVVSSDGSVVAAVIDPSGKKQPEQYLKNLPQTTEDFEQSDSIIRRSLYQAAVIFKDRFNDIPKANEYFQALNDRFPNHPDKAKTSYQLYRSYDKMGDQQKAEIEKAKILSEFPNSEYALLIKYPNRGAEEEKQKKELESYYGRVYQAYQAQRYDTVLAFTQQIKANYPKGPQLAQFDLISAFAVGRLRGEAEFERALKGVTTDYAGTTSAQEAQAILQTLNDRRMSAMQDAKAAEAALKAFDTIVTGAQQYVLIFSSELIDSSELVRKVKELNEKSFKSLNLKVVLKAWEGPQKIISISSFQSGPILKQYREQLQLRVLDVTNNAGNLHFFITPDNLKKLETYRETEKYLEFYQKHYPF